jgi:hypothetical protein
MHAPLQNFLNAPEGTAHVFAHGRMLLTLCSRFQTIVPSGLGASARVANFRSGIVVIHAENGAVAAKLRQMSRRLSDEFKKVGVECSDIEIKVQPTQTFEHSITSTEKPISAAAATVLGETAQGMPGNSLLRAALENLLQRSARKAATQEK